MTKSKTMEGAPKYQPSEESMAEEQKKMSDEHAFDQWEPKDGHIKEYKESRDDIVLR